MFGKGGVCYFSHRDGGGQAILSSRNWGGQHFFSYSEAVCHPHSAEIYEQSLKAPVKGATISLSGGGGLEDFFSIFFFQLMLMLDFLLTPFEARCFFHKELKIRFFFFFFFSSHICFKSKIFAPLAIIIIMCFSVLLIYQCTHMYM